MPATRHRPIIPAASRVTNSPSSSRCWACHSSASTAGRHFKFNEAVSFQVYTDSQEETDRYWNAIVGNGGQESQCGWCKDKFGLSWQITPRALMNAMADPDRAAAKRAMEAMMGMKKIDIAAIERARAGRAVA